VKKVRSDTKTARRAARQSKRAPEQQSRPVRIVELDRRRRPPLADAVADIEKSVPNFVEREMERIYAHCKATLERRRTRNAVVDKLQALLVEARNEMERGWPPDPDPSVTRRTLVSWQSPAIAEELERFDRACSELRSLLDPFPRRADDRRANVRA
jgi:hypothetical protein